MQASLATSLFIAFGMASAPAAFAHEAHTHQHGVASLELSQEADTLVVAFRSPLDSLVGFESSPTSASQRKQVARLREQLKQVGAIVKLPAAAGCTQQDIDIDAPDWVEADHDDRDDGHDHGKKKQGKGHDHDRTTAATAHDDDGHHHDRGSKAHAHDGHDHDADDDHGHGHADLAVSYTLRCSKGDALKTLTVSAFGTWPRLRQIDAAAVSDRGQKAARLTPRQNTLRW